MMMLLLAVTLISCTKKTEAPVFVETKIEGGTKTETMTMPTLQIELADRACVKDTDCEHIQIQCSCDCGQGINKNNVQKYVGKLEELCKSYEGQICKMACDGAVKCIDKVCTYK